MSYKLNGIFVYIPNFYIKNLKFEYNNLIFAKL